MKRLPILIVIVGLLAACGTGGAGKLGPVPTGAASATSPAATAGATQPAGGGQAPAPVPTATSPPSAAGQVSLQAWFTRQGKLFGTQHGVPATASVGRAALDQLLAGP